jgi:hypothetical protein
MLLASNKQPPKEITKQQKKHNKIDKNTEENEEQVSLQEIPYLQESIQNHSENSKC